MEQFHNLEGDEVDDACLTACFGWIMPFASLEFPTHLKSQTWANNM